MLPYVQIERGDLPGDVSRCGRPRDQRRQEHFVVDERLEAQQRNLITQRKFPVADRHSKSAEKLRFPTKPSV